MIVNQLMVHQAVKVGPNYVTSFTPDKFSMEFDHTIQCWKMVEKKTGIIVYVSMYNVPWFGVDGEQNDTRTSDRSDESNEGNGSCSIRAGGAQSSVPAPNAEPKSSRRSKS